ncbi:MAG TPA: hypothetical protein VN721_12620 [Flavipsychrobacter sp.]|nr:hypothetical protein [Flavipsychrobacter sp.]
MKRIATILFLLLSLSASTVYLQSCSMHEKQDNAIPALLETKANIAPQEETDNIKSTYDKAVQALKDNPDDMKQYLTLASVFIAEGRITGNGNYYSNAAAKMLNKVIDAHPASQDMLFQAYSLKSAVLLNMHQFKDALDVAQKGTEISVYNAGIWGAMVDANVELGHYDSAVKDCDRMLSIRPDLRSYSRASYLRQIYGDNRGAIEAMKMAVEAGPAGAESTEWARVKLGDLYMNIGSLDTAAFIYSSSLVYRPNYPYAMMGLASVQKAKKNYDSAIYYTRSAIQLLSEAAFVSYLGDLYELKGDSNKAADVRNDVVNLLEQGQKDEAKDAIIKHNINREMAMAYLNDNKVDKALQYAQNDLNMRPDNIDANNLIAWIYYLKGDYTNAKIHADKMLLTNTKNANTLYEASVIYTRTGDTIKGNELMQQAKAINPFIDQKIVNETGHQYIASK